MIGRITIFILIVLFTSFLTVNNYYSIFGSSLEKNIVNNLMIFSNATNSTTGTEPVIFTAFKLEKNILDNLTKDELEKMKANMSSSASIYINQTLDKLYTINSINGTVIPTVYTSKLIDDIIKILGLFF